ncbi:MAG TPA: hypothetical protein VFS00_13685 [Polyangiaceae bacterium]|nr:hypothetical protein [Polyangiaceae bacterium]
MKTMHVIAGVFLSATLAFGCASALDEGASEAEAGAKAATAGRRLEGAGREGAREAPAAARQGGVAFYAGRADENGVKLTLLSESGRALGALSAHKDLALESLAIALTLPGVELTVSKSKDEATLRRNGRAVALADAGPELEVARALLVEVGFLREQSAPPAPGHEAAEGAADASSAEGSNAVCSSPLRSGCYRSSNQAWACAQAVPGTCVLGYCYEWCGCYDDSQWYDFPWTVYVCCAEERCN